MSKLAIIHPDPLGILTSTKKVVENSVDVSIRPETIAEAAQAIMERKKQGFDTFETGFGSAEDLADAVQLIFLEDVVNFCFWPDKGEKKWEVVWPEDTEPQGDGTV